MWPRVSAAPSSAIYQSDSEPLEKAALSVTWSAGLELLCLLRPCTGFERPSSSSVEELSLRETLRVEREELKLALISPLRVNGRLLV